MPNLDAWFIAGGKALDHALTHERASGIGFMADYREGLDVVLVRAGVSLSSQRVVLTWIAGTTSTTNSGAAGSTGNLDLILTGPKGHPTLSDFNVAKGDKFSFSHVVGSNTIVARYEVTFVDTSLDGKIDAHCKRSVQ